MNITILRDNLQKELLINKLYDLLELKNKINFPLDVKELSGLYDGAIFIDKKEYDDQSDVNVYDEEGFELLEIKPPYIDDYSVEDYLQDDSLLISLKEKIKIIENSKVLILFNS